jgi:hypothetical protein
MRIIFQKITKLSTLSFYILDFGVADLGSSARERNLYGYKLQSALNGLSSLLLRHVRYF